MTKNEKLFGEGWAKLLQPFLDSQVFKNIGIELKRQQTANTRIYPVFDDVFRCFKECPLEDTVAVFAGVNPYVYGQADGLLFSTQEQSESSTPQLLTKMFDELEKDTKQLYLARDNDLTRWANQGILLLPLDLTTVKGKPTAHLELWSPMMRFLFRTLGKEGVGITYVLFGKHAHEYDRYLDPLSCDYYYLEHPMSAVKEQRNWRSNKIFTRISSISKLIHDKEINWI